MTSTHLHTAYIGAHLIAVSYTEIGLDRAVHQWGLINNIGADEAISYRKLPLVVHERWLDHDYFAKKRREAWR